MKAEPSNTKAENQGARQLVALPETVEVQVPLSEDMTSEADLLDRLIGQQILALFGGADNTEL